MPAFHRSSAESAMRSVLVAAERSASREACVASAPSSEAEPRIGVSRSRSRLPVAPKKAGVGWSEVSSSGGSTSVIVSLWSMSYAGTAGNVITTVALSTRRTCSGSIAGCIAAFQPAGSACIDSRAAASRRRSASGSAFVSTLCGVRVRVRKCEC